MSRLSGEQVKIGYGDSMIINNLDVAILMERLLLLLDLTGVGNQLY